MTFENSVFNKCYTNDIRKKKEELEKLANIRTSEELLEVTHVAELRQKVKEQKEEFIVKGDFCKLMKDIKQSQVSEAAEIGFELGSGGLGTLIAQGVLRVINFFAEDTKLENLKQDIGRFYKIDFINENEVKLRLKQLDY